MNKQQIKDLLIQAMKDKNDVAKEAYRSVISEIDLVESKESLSDDRVISIIRKEAQKFQDSSESFREKDEKLVDRYTNCAIILSALLPKQISSDQFPEILKEFSDMSFAQIMKEAKSKYGNSINMKDFSCFVQKNMRK